MDALGKLARFDIFPKLEDDYSVSTKTGALVSVVTALVASLLFVTELSTYMSTAVTHHVKVDTEIAETLQINLRIDFPAMRCGAAMLDVMDVAGEQQINVDMGLWKRRMAPDGSWIGDEYLDHHRVDPHSAMREVVLPNGMRIMRQLPAGQEGHAHGHGHGAKDDAADPSRDGEGCQLHGSIRASKVAGNIHVALGASHKSGGRHVHHFQYRDAEKFNTTHTIRELSFGAAAVRGVPGVGSPLEGVTRTVERGAGHYQYFLKIVPTDYDAPNGTRVSTHAYSVTEQSKMMDLGNGQPGKIPGVFFVYDLSPFRVTVGHAGQPFADFVISVCAIIGGAVTIASLVDGALYHGQQVIRRMDSERSAKVASTPETELARSRPTGILSSPDAGAGAGVGAGGPSSAGPPSFGMPSPLTSPASSAGGDAPRAFGGEGVSAARRPAAAAAAAVAGASGLDAGAPQFSPSAAPAPPLPPSGAPRPPASKKE